MVVKMMKWSPWPPSTSPATRKFQVTVNQMKLQGFGDGRTEDSAAEQGNKRGVVMIRLRWRGERKAGIVPFYRNSKGRRDISGERTVNSGGIVEWDDEFENQCCFTMGSRAGEYGPWDVYFYLLFGEGEKSKMNVIGKVSIDIGEMASKIESQQVNTSIKLPLTLHPGFPKQATLLISLSFLEIRDSQNSPELVNNSISIQSQELEVKVEENKQDVNLDGSDESNTINPDIDPVSSPSLETQVKKVGLFSWKKRRLSFKSAKDKSEPLIKKDKEEGDEKKDIQPHLTSSNTNSTNASVNQEQIVATSTGNWETKELISRDGQTKLKADLFFASFDQRSDKAAGESACTALVAVIAHWLHSNQDATPTKPEFDQLIIDGSLEWRNLCENETYLTDFPNRHFDLDTILRAGVRPVSVSPDQSFVGFFGAEKFEILKGAMSFDEIWSAVSKNTCCPRVYIVSWNDHFFVLKAEADAYYIIDTLGERLYEGCENAYILRFDETTVMYANKEKDKVKEGEIDGENIEKVNEEEIICSGKECCREFMKRFLVAIQLKELESEEEKETVSYYSLHQRLQIEFNFSICESTKLLSTSGSSSSSSSSSLTSSLFSNEDSVVISVD